MTLPVLTLAMLGSRAISIAICLAVLRFASRGTCAVLWQRGPDDAVRHAADLWALAAFAISLGTLFWSVRFVLGFHPANLPDDPLTVVALNLITGGAECLVLFATLAARKVR